MKLTRDLTSLAQRLTSWCPTSALRLQHLIALLRPTACATLVAGSMAVVLTATPVSAAALLLGTGTLDTADDLTRIQTESGDVLEFLDLTATDGLSVASALATYSTDGFRWADDTEIAPLLEAFGISYAIEPMNLTVLGGVGGGNNTNFANYLGTTTGDASIGWFDALTTATQHSYLCVGPQCSSGGFTFNALHGWPSNQEIGVFLVRDGADAVPVPEPASLTLLGLGLSLAGMSARRRRQRKPDDRRDERARSALRGGIVLLAVLAGGSRAQASTITTMFAWDNFNVEGGANYFDVDVLDPLGITITSLGVNTADDPGLLTVNIYTRSGTAFGNETSPAGWTLVSTGTGVPAGGDSPSLVDVADFFLGPGLTGFAIENVNYSSFYTNGTGSNQFYSDANLSLTMGTANLDSFFGQALSPRVWNGQITYDEGSSETPIPEPASLTLLGLGLAGMAGRRWRQRKAS